MKTLTAFYDLAVGPVSYDVITWLIRAMLAREDAGCEALHVVVVPNAAGVDGMFRDKLALYDADEMHWRLWQLVLPACRLAGATVTLATDWAQARKLAQGDVWPANWCHQTLADRVRAHMWGPIVAAARAGRTIPTLQASGHARKHVRSLFARSGKPVVTCTLRETYEPARNADLAAWDTFRRSIEDRWQVWVLRDTARALEAGAGYGELVLDLRLALYQEAAVNLHCHGGPAALSWFSGAPFLAFGVGLPEPYAVVHRSQGMAIGEQLPWATPQQRLIYAPPSADILAREFAAWCAGR